MDKSRYIIYNNQLQADDFIRLFADAGWGNIPKDIVEVSLANSYASFCVKKDDKVVAMARLLGDGGMSFFLKDFVVESEERGKGIGKMLLFHVENYIKGKLNVEWKQYGWKGYLQLISAKGKEEFYNHMGYISHPNEKSGAGMSKWIEI